VKQAGFTIIEVMVALLVGAFLLGGVMFTYVGMRTTADETLDIGELQEAGRLAMDVLKQDIEMAGFFGTLNQTPDVTFLTNIPSQPSKDCSEGDNNGSFPAASGSAFRYVYARQVTSASVLNCISNANEGTDVIQLKGLLGTEMSAASSATNRYYMLTEVNSGSIIKGTGAVIATPGNSRVWEYFHNVYYIADQSFQYNGNNISVPTLMRQRLTSTGMSSETIMEGVEHVRFLFGMDVNGDGRVDQYRPSENMSRFDWEQQNANIATVQVFLLVRTLTESRKTAEVQNFTLGGDAEGERRDLNYNDRYRRKLFVSTIGLMNSGSDKWSM
jgi:type IV pilus assembly protein PilW